MRSPFCTAAAPLFCISVLLFTVVVIPAHAGEEYVRWYRGDCSASSSGEWIIVVTYNDAGRPVHICGTCCDGLSWEGHCDVGPLSTNPEQAGSYYYKSVNPDDSWCCVSVHPNGMLKDLWGRDTAGAYWVISNLSIS